VYQFTEILYFILRPVVIIVSPHVALYLPGQPLVIWWRVASDKCSEGLCCRPELQRDIVGEKVWMDGNAGLKEVD
jgi:hypothetical protein